MKKSKNKEIIQEEKLETSEDSNDSVSELFLSCINTSNPEDNKVIPDDETDEEDDYPVVCADCGEEKMCSSLQDAYDQGWFATEGGEHCPEHAEAAIKKEDNKAPANNCLTYN